MSPGAVIDGRFEIEAKIGAGGMAVVYRARDRSTGDIVALKVGLGHIADLERRMAREARLLQTIDHPNVVRCSSFGVTPDGAPWIALEWLEGEDVLRRQVRMPMELAELIDFGHQAGLALAAIHDAGIIHRDIKPANFFLTRAPDGRPRVKLLDLGVARSWSEPLLTRDGTRLGTPAYMSPEQARSEQLSGASDIFSLGVVLYELIARRRPFQGHDPFAVLAKIVLEPPPPLRDLVVGLPVEVEHVVMRALAKDPSARFSSARDLAYALASIALDTSAVVVAVKDEPAPEGDQTVLSPFGTPGIAHGFERRVVTALFAALDRAPKPEEAIATFETIARGHGASTFQMLGHRALAVFGMPRSAGDEPLRAAHSARSALAALPHARLALATGRADSGASALSGELIDRGAALVDHARDVVMLDASTARLLSPWFHVDEAGADHVLRAPRAAVAVERTLLGKVEPFVGRDRELAALLGAFEQCDSESTAQAVIVTGPAGAGKSRLRDELVRRLDDRPAHVLLARGDPVGAGSSFAMLARALRRESGVLDGEPIELQRDKLAAALGQNVAPDERASVVGFLGELAHVPFPDEWSEVLRIARADPRTLADGIRHAWERWLDTECGARPVLLVLEDLQWGDAATASLVGSALRNLRDRPFMVLALSRPELERELPPIFRDVGLQHIRLAPLGRRASESLVKSALGDDADATTVGRIVDRAEGNPLFLEELVRAVDAAGAASAIDALPDTVLGVVQARLDTLGLEAKRILRAASVFGGTFWVGGLATLLGVNVEDPQLEAWLGELSEREIIGRRPVSRFPGDRELAFRHPLVRDAAYAMLPPEARTQAHAAAATWLERVGETDALTLAQHLERGGVPERAIRWWLRAGEVALEADDLPAALERAERGIAAGATHETLGALELIRACASNWRGDYAEAHGRASAAVEKLTPGGARWYQAISEAIGSAGRRGEYDRVVAWIAIARSTRPQLAARNHEIVCLASGAVNCMHGTRYATARELRELLERKATEMTVDPRALGWLERLRGTEALHAGDVGGYLAAVERAAGHFRRAGDRRGDALHRVHVGYAYGLLGEYASAERELREVVVVTQRLGIELVSANALHNLGLFVALGGGASRLGEAREIERRVVDALGRQGDRRLAGGSQAYLAIIETLAGNGQAAEAHARAALETIAGIPSGEAVAWAALGNALLLLGRPAEALDATGRGDAIVDALGRIEELEAYVRVAHIEALRENGQVDDARSRTAEAVRQLRERAALIADASQRQSFLTKVAHHARLLELELELELEVELELGPG